MSETESTMAMLKKASGYLKEQQKEGLQMAKKVAEYLKEARNSFSGRRPKWEEDFRGYHNTFHQNIFIMVGSSCISIYCGYCYFFHNVEKEVSVLKVTLKEVETRSLRVDKGLALSRAIATKKAKELAQFKAESKKRSEELEKVVAQVKAESKKSVEKNVEMTCRVEKLEKEVAQLKAESKKKNVEELNMEMTCLKKVKEAHKQAPPPMHFLSGLMTFTPVPPEHAAALVEMRHHELHMQAWKKRWMV